jgi:hypothetical protein
VLGGHALFAAPGTGHGAACFKLLQDILHRSPPDVRGNLGEADRSGKRETENLQSSAEQRLSNCEVANNSLLVGQLPMHLPRRGSFIPLSQMDVRTALLQSGLCARAVDKAGPEA